MEKVYTSPSASWTERVLDYAAEKLFLNVTITRVGQIAGPIYSTGAWNRWEWLPSLVISSLHIGAVPDSLGPSQDKIDWISIDVLAEVLVELTLEQQPEAEMIDALTETKSKPHGPAGCDVGSAPPSRDKDTRDL
jgi:thioester reductase-like protein